LAVVISAARRSPQNFWYVSWLASITSLLLQGSYLVYFNPAPMISEFGLNNDDA
jgi:hypothetical protein